jgi:hypothetical protein
MVLNSSTRLWSSKILIDYNGEEPFSWNTKAAIQAAAFIAFHAHEVISTTNQLSWNSLAICSGVFF